MKVDPQWSPSTPRCCSKTLASTLCASGLRHGDASQVTSQPKPPPGTFSFRVDLAGFDEASKGSIGFAPLGAGLYIGLTLGDEGAAGLGIAGVGAASIVAGAVLWGIRGMQLRRFRQARASLAAQGPRARLRWRGLAPFYDPQRRTHGASVGFAF